MMWMVVRRVGAIQRGRRERAGKGGAVINFVDSKLTAESEVIGTWLQSYRADTPKALLLGEDEWC